MGALIAIRFSNPEQLLPAIEFLETLDFLECWHAVDGHVDIIAQLRTSASNIPNELKSYSGIEELYVYEIIGDIEKGVVCDPAVSHSFVFLEVDPQKGDDVKKTLGEMEHVYLCAGSNKSSDFVAIVNGEDFDAIDRIVNERIRTLNGVLRVKQDRVINLTQI